MSYNTHDFFQTASPRTSVKPAKGIKALAEVIRRENPDILAVQEIEGRQVLDDLNQNELGGAYHVLAAPGSNDPRGISVGYLYKKDITLESWTSHLNVLTPNGSRLLRDALLAKFKFTTDSGAEDSLYTVTAHLKSMRGGEAQTAPIRAQEALVIHNIVSGVLQADPQARIAVMGDLNTKSQTQHGQRVLKAMGALGSNPILTDIFDGRAKIPPTQRGLRQPERLDYILVTPNLFKDKIKAKVSGGFKAWPWKDASDHLPVSVTVNAAASAGQASTVTPIKFASAYRQPLSIYA